jgi:hypothetical protein
MIVLVIKISAQIFTWLIRIRIWNPHLECGMRMRIRNTGSKKCFINRRWKTGRARIREKNIADLEHWVKKKTAKT